MTGLCLELSLIEPSERDPPEIPEWALNAQASDLDTSTTSSV